MSYRTWVINSWSVRSRCSWNRRGSPKNRYSSSGTIVASSREPRRVIATTSTGQPKRRTKLKTSRRIPKWRIREEDDRPIKSSRSTRSKSRDARVWPSRWQTRVESCHDEEEIRGRRWRVTLHGRRSQRVPRIPRTGHPQPSRRRFIRWRQDIRPDVVDRLLLDSLSATASRQSHRIEKKARRAVGNLPVVFTVKKNCKSTVPNCKRLRKN